MKHLQTAMKSGSPCQNETDMSTTVRYAIFSDTNAHFPSVIYVAY